MSWSIYCPDGVLYASGYSTSIDAHADIIDANFDCECGFRTGHYLVDETPKPVDSRNKAPRGKSTNGKKKDPYRCSVCGQIGHTKRYHDERNGQVDLSSSDAGAVRQGERAS